MTSYTATSNTWKIISKWVSKGFENFAHYSMNYSMLCRKPPRGLPNCIWMSFIWMRHYEGGYVIEKVVRERRNYYFKIYFVPYFSFFRRPASFVNFSQMYFYFRLLFFQDQRTIQLGLSYCHRSFCMKRKPQSLVKFKSKTMSEIWKTLCQRCFPQTLGIPQALTFGFS